MWKDEINIATQWLIRIQNEDGGWSPPYDNIQLSGISTTALVLEALARSNTKVLDILKKGINFLLAYQQEDGGWPDRSVGCSLVIETAQALNALLQIKKLQLNNLPSFDNAIRNALNWLVRNQNDDGGWGLWLNERHGSLPHHAAWSTIALSEAIGHFQISIDERELILKTLRKAQTYFLNEFEKPNNEIGGWRQHKLAKYIDPHTTSFALFALSHTREVTVKLSEVAKMCKKYLINSMTVTGKWENTVEETVISVRFEASAKSIDIRRVKWWIAAPITILALQKVCGQRVFSKEIQEALFALKRQQNQDGGWGLSEGRSQTWVTAQVISMLVQVENDLDPTLEIGELIKQNISLRQNLLDRINADSTLLDALSILAPEVSKSRPVILFGKRGFYLSKRMLVFFAGLLILSYEFLVFQTDINSWLVNIGVLRSTSQSMFVLQGLAAVFLSDVIMRLLDRPFHERIAATTATLLGTILLGLYAP